MPALPFPISSAPGEKPQEGAGRLFNCRAVKTEEGARFPVVWRRAAGLAQMAHIADDIHLRGAINVSTTAILVMDTEVYSMVDSGGGVFTTADLGGLTGTDRITIAKNNAQPSPDIVAVSDQGAFNLFTGLAPTPFVLGSMPQPISVTCQAGYFFFAIGNGQLWASDLNSPTVQSNSFTTVQKRSGGLLRAEAFRDEIFAFGPAGCEVYRDAGAVPFPYEYHVFIPRGIAGTHAVAGFEEGWANELIWVGDDGIVYQLDGYTPVPVSTDDVSRIIALALREGQGPTLEASVQMEGLFPIWKLTNPGVWTWEYNVATKNWNERESFGTPDQRVSCSFKAFNRWVQGDRTTGLIFGVDETAFLEGTDPLVYRLRSGAGAIFPSRMEIPRLDFDFTTAVGVSTGQVPIQTDPVALISWSKDGGYSFCSPITRKIGKQGEGNHRIKILRGPATGPKGVVLEIAISDPVHAGFMGCTYAVEQRAE